MSSVKETSGEAVVFSHPEDARKVPGRLAGRPLVWLYLGKDINQRAAISRVLGGDRYHHIGDLLQQVARREKGPFLDFVAGLGEHQPDKARWWASNVAYKSPLTSDLFLHWCYAAVLAEVISGEVWGKTRTLVVFIENRWLYRYLWLSYRQAGSRFSFTGRKSVLPELVKMTTWGIAARGYAALRIWWQKMRLGGPPVAARPGQREVYIYAEVSDQCFQREGEFRERNFGRLKDALKSAGLSITYVTYPFLSAGLRRKCLRAAGERFLFLDRYAGWVDLWRGFFSLPGVVYPEALARQYPFMDVLLRYETARDIPSFSRTILMHRVFRRWFSQVDHPVTIVYPFENQPWEKMLCLAGRERDNIRLVGYQHAGVSNLLLNYFAGKGEAATMPVPDYLVAGGEYTLKLFQGQWPRGVELRNGGALRYEYLHRGQPGRPGTSGEKGPRRVLVAFTYSPSLTMEMLTALFSAFGDTRGEDIGFLLKFHPDVPPERLGAGLLPWPAHFQVAEQPVSELVRGIDLVLYSSSTVGLETYLKGIPVIRYDSEHMLALDPMDCVDGAVVASCSAGNMREMVLSALSEDRRSQTGGLPLVDVGYFFSPPHFDSWREVIGGGR